MTSADPPPGPPGPLTVLKFGGSVLGCEADLARAMREVEGCVRGGGRVLVVVSALRGRTDHLLEEGEGRRLDDGALARHIARGEEECADLALSCLDLAGIPALRLDVDEVGPFTRGSLLDAEPSGLAVDAIERALSRVPVVVLPGFLGRDGAGARSLLGRGGSDLTAIYAAECLRASECRLIKALSALFDPRAPLATRPRRRVCAVSPEELHLHWPGIVQEKALERARRAGLRFFIGSLSGAEDILVEPGALRIEELPPRP
jgi:homoserine dehydrogenase